MYSIFFAGSVYIYIYIIYKHYWFPLPYQVCIRIETPNENNVTEIYLHRRHNAFLVYIMTMAFLVYIMTMLYWSKLDKVILYIFYNHG